MRKFNPFARSYTVTCPDGTTHEVYKNIDHVFPLFFGEVEASIGTKINTEVAGDGELSGKYRKKVDALLFNIDDLNSSAMFGFRATYMTYQSSPCLKHEFLSTEVSKINEENRRLRALKMQIFGFVEMARTSSGSPVELARLYTELVSKIGTRGTIEASVVAEEMKSATEAAKSLSGRTDEPVVASVLDEKRDEIEILRDIPADGGRVESTDSVESIDNNEK